MAPEVAALQTQSHRGQAPWSSRISSARAHRCGLSSMWPNAMDSLCLKIARKHSPAGMHGHPETDAAMFSFGSIKTATAIAGPWYVCAIQDCSRKFRPFRKHILNSRPKNIPGTAYPCLREVVHHALLFDSFIVRALRSIKTLSASSARFEICLTMKKAHP